MIYGDSPGAYVCAIYLYTANIPVVVIKAPSSLKYNCQYVAGLPDITNPTFNEGCMKQARHVGIEVVDGAGATVALKDGLYTSDVNGVTYSADYIVTDERNTRFSNANTYFSVEDFIMVPEAIDVAAAGCKVAFEIKEILS